MDTGFLEGVRLEVYSAPACPECTRLTRWLEAAGLEHDEVDIARSPEAAARLETETGKRAVPFILVDGVTWVRGYHREEPGRFSPRVLLEELTEAVSGV